MARSVRALFAALLLAGVVPADAQSAVVAGTAPLPPALKGAAQGALIATEEAKLYASDAATFDRLGSAVAIEGDTAIVGAVQDNNVGGIDAGAAYVFVRDGTSWTEEAKLVASDGDVSDLFGASVAISGDTALVGSYQDDHDGKPDAGSAYVFVRSGRIWTEQAKLTALVPGQDDVFGWCVSLSGDTAAIGAYGDGHIGGLAAGAAYVFVRDGTTWSQQAKLAAADAATDDVFGWSIAVSGDTVVVGAPFDDHSTLVNPGSVYAFVRSGTSWSQQARLSASDAAFNDRLGWSVALSGDTVISGASGDDNIHGVNAGAAYAFVRSGASWTQQAKLMASDGALNDDFGWTVALEGDTALVGAPLDDPSDGANLSTAYLFVRHATCWTEDAVLMASDGAPDREYGFAVAVSGDTGIVGAVAEDPLGITEAGAAYVTRLTDDGSPFTDLGFGLAGTNGVPRFSGDGTLVEATPGGLLLGNARASSLALLFVSFSSAPTPFRGGTLVPFPFSFLFSFITNAGGQVALNWLSWPAGIPPATTIYFQYAIQDPLGPLGAAMSNALLATTP